MKKITNRYAGRGQTIQNSKLRILFAQCPMPNTQYPMPNAQKLV
ncbi:hypothetical protein [Tolypothrix sp. FACHB-123]|nr:hypothetical protein [Tolypothrix sp. FACHB-123]